MKKFISIKTDIPGPKSRELAVIRERYVFKPMGESLSPGYIDFGEGALVTDVDGNTFIDLTGGWGCLALGHSHPAIISAIKEQ
ncbi:MAG: aminotransferase class III-fold pyridoxal phosphate-dependent enzyme, partial [Atribacterota bacterium]|nr:aminotransferase class III-fold pyridoxal phosphate-dependent enzyme [Atribacterota bacterium]